MSQSLSLTSARLTPTTAQAPRVGIVAAVLLHAALIGATLYSLQHSTFQIAEDEPPSVPVELVTIADKTNVTPTAPRIVKPSDEPKPPEQLPAPTPTPTPPQDTAPPEPTPAPAIQPKPTPAPQAKPLPTHAPDEQKKPKPDAVAALLDKFTAPTAAPRNARVAPRTTKGAGDMSAATADLRDALRALIKPCWTPPVGAPSPEELVVDFDLFLNADGSVARAPQLTADSQARAARDPFTRAAAEAARRAIFTCAPYKLPKERYDQWNEINPFHFDPRQMMGE